MNNKKPYLIRRGQLHESHNIFRLIKYYGSILVHHLETYSDSPISLWYLDDYDQNFPSFILNTSYLIWISYFPFFIFGKLIYLPFSIPCTEIFVKLFKSFRIVLHSHFLVHFKHSNTLLNFQHYCTHVNLWAKYRNRIKCNYNICRLKTVEQSKLKFSSTVY